MDNGVGADIHCNNSSFSESLWLPDGASVFQAEILAIWIAIAIFTGYWPITERLGISFNSTCRISCNQSSEKETLYHFLCECPAYLSGKVLMVVWLLDNIENLDVLLMYRDVLEKCKRKSRFIIFNVEKIDKDL